METDSFLDRITNYMGCDKMQPEYVFHKNFTTEAAA
jgi:hypothetical protein